jgi:succinate dehydrogenase / fumarate reductase cytochrome b subunit
MATANVWHFYLRRLHSLSGIVPIGVFLLQHLFGNGYALRGPQAFNEHAEFLLGLPYVTLIEASLIFLPILFHGIYGLFISAEADLTRPGQGIGARYHNLAFLFQRLTGIVLVVFIGYHVWNTRLQGLLFGATVDYAYMARYFAPTYEKLVYIAGVLCACYHFAHGLFNVTYKWGITVGARAQQAMTYVSIAVFLALSAVGIQIVFAFK